MDTSVFASAGFERREILRRDRPRHSESVQDSASLADIHAPLNGTGPGKKPGPQLAALVAMALHVGGYPRRRIRASYKRSPHLGIVATAPLALERIGANVEQYNQRGYVNAVPP